MVAEVNRRDEYRATMNQDGDPERTANRTNLQCKKVIRSSLPVGGGRLVDMVVMICGTCVVVM